MRLKDILEGICIRKDGESDEEFVQRCGNELTREPDRYNDRDTSYFKLKSLMARKPLSKDMKWNQGFQLEADIVNDNEVDRNDVLLHKLNKALIKIRKKANVLEGDINKPSPKLRPEPHPTRHETEHPPYEKDAMKSPMPKFTPPTKK
jgi:hypothetical protein